MGIAEALALLGGVALFLFGMSLMGDGLKRIAGSRLEVVLYRLSSTPLRGIVLGTGVTAVIQSSSATSVMVVGFVNSGMLNVDRAIGIVLGSCLGTSVTGWILCLSNISGSGWVSLLSTATLTSIVAVAGIILRMFAKKQRSHYLGDILLGFAVLMFGMQTMSAAVSGLRQVPAFLDLITSFSHPLLGILAGFLLAAILQSASAGVGILQALSITGTLDFSETLPMILGVAIGAAVPVLLSALGANTGGKRTAVVYLLINVLGAALVALVFYGVNLFVPYPFLTTVMDPVKIAALNSAYRLAYVLLLAPLIGVMERVVCLMIPDKPEDLEAQAAIDRLEERFLDHPALAVEQSRLTINDMATGAQRNIQIAFGLFGLYTEDRYNQVQAMENLIDRYEDKLGSYLMRLTGKDMGGEESRAVSKYLHTLGDFERISDHAVNIADAAKEIHEKNLQLSADALGELDVLTGAVVEVLDLAVTAFVKDDRDLAGRVEPLEEHIDGLCDEMKLRHVQRLQKGECTLVQGFVFNDLLTNYERVADHCSNIAVAILELATGSLDTHQYLQGVKEQRSEAFQRYLEEYQRKYALK